MPGYLGLIATTARKHCKFKYTLMDDTDQTAIMYYMDSSRNFFLNSIGWLIFSNISFVPPVPTIRMVP